MVIAVVAALLGVSAAAAPPAAEVCRGIIAAPSSPAKRRIVTADDLLRLRDIGFSDDRTSGPSPLAASPNGRRIAFVMRRADPSANRYCVALVVVPIDGQTGPVVLDLGEDPIRYPDYNRGLDLGRSGNLAVITPRWSPDGWSIAILKNVDGVAQLWLASLDGRQAAAMTHLREGVDDFAWTADGQGIVISHRRTEIAEETAIETEARSGFLYDRRTWAIASARPSPQAQPSPAFDVVGIATSALRGASAQEAALIAGRPAEAPPGAVLAAVRPKHVAYVATTGPAYLSATRLHVVLDGREVACSVTACSSLTSALWWSASGALSWLHTEDGDETGRMALYRWVPGRGIPRRLFDTSDLVTGCIRLGDAEAACLRESSGQPKQLVALDLRTGRSRIVFDPNPAFAELRLGTVRRLIWTSRYGVRTFGDLVLPPDHQPGQRHPLIVVQYDSRGFLRGGTGDEYPIQLFAAHGFAVLVTNKSATQSGLAPADDIDAYQDRAIPASAYRRRTLALMEAGVAAAVATGTVDRSRMGVTGLSDGALTACFALMHTQLFKAASISSGCEEPVTNFAEVGPAYHDDLVRWGYPYPDRDPDGFWNDNALSRNLTALRTPILVQTADREFRLALETWATAREYRRPFEIIVFPDEYHIKWQPAHREAIYQRNLDWFDFWLRGIERPDPGAAAQYLRWRALRSASTAASASTEPRPQRPQAPAAAAAPAGATR